MQCIVIDFGRIDLTSLGSITPLNFQGYLIIALAKDWANSFPEIRRFDVSINNEGKIAIISQLPIRGGK